MERLGGDTEREQAHYAARVRLAQLPVAMAEHFTPGHEAQQTAEYEQLRDTYLQEQTNLQWLDRGITSKSHISCG